MKNTTVGAEESITSISNNTVPLTTPDLTFTNVEAVVKAATDDSDPSTRTFTAIELEKDRTESVSYIVNYVTMPSLRVLLTKVLSAIDASTPNKEQNRAVKKIVRDAFDEAYFRILHGAYPMATYGQSEGYYALEPEPDKKPNVIL
jgi:hypothetical protein